MRLPSALLVVALAGCALSHEGSGLGSFPGDDGGGVAPDAAIITSGSHVRTYVIGRIIAEPPLASPDQSWGFDLDGMVGGRPGSCTDQEDYVSPVTGARGVDNQFGTLVPTLDGLVGGDGVDGVYRQRIEGGDLIAVLQLSGIDDETNDSAVQVHLVLATASVGVPASSTACPYYRTEAQCIGDTTEACGWSMMYSACSGIARGQHFVTRMDFGTTTGAISGGRLTATASGLPIELFVGLMSQPLVVHDLHIEARLAGDTLVQGELGGNVFVAELQAAIDAMGLGIDITSFVTPDLGPSAGGVTCSGVSAGLSFAAIPATLD